MNRTMILRRGVLVLGLAGLLFANIACHAEANVRIVDNAYKRQITAIVGSGDVIWNNQGERRHTVTSTEDFFDSGTITSGDNYGRGFDQAGGFVYHCTFHRMKGRINVPTQVDPDSGTTAGSYTVTWAFFDPSEGPGPASIPPGLDMDVQVKTPGADRYVALVTDQTGTDTSTSYSPTDGPGVYLFRARLQRTATGEASKLSPAARLDVTAP